MENKKQNHSILISTVIFISLFVGMIGYLLYFNFAKAESVINNSYNKRQNVLSKKTVRGNILSSDKTILATTVVNEDGTEKRYYPYANIFSHVVGYLNNGGYGLESSNCYYMLQSNQNFFDKIKNDLNETKNQGDSIITTLDYKLQQICYGALGDNRGAVVAIEPSTGKILAMVSKPDFDPNTLAENWSDVISFGSDSILLNRALQGLYPPGSTFKLVTMLEYIRENKNDFLDYSYTCDGSYELSNTTINCMKTTAHGTLDIFNSLGLSCNCSFINMGLELDMEKYQKTAEKLLFNKDIPIDLYYNKSQFKLNEKSSTWDIAQTSFGQGETLITPFHLALIGSSIANDGVLMKPYLVSAVQNCNGVKIKKFKSEKYGELMTEEEAKLLQNGMELVIKDSYSWLFNEGTPYSVAGKSGSAQYGAEGYEHSLFISYSPVETPEIVLSVVVEGGPQRNTTAAEISKIIYDAYYSSK